MFILRHSHDIHDSRRTSWFVAVVVFPLQSQGEWNAKTQEGQQLRRNLHGSRSWNPWVSIYFLEQEMPLKVIRAIGPLGLAHDLPFIKNTNWIIFLRFCCNASARGRLEPCRPCGPRNLPRSGHSCGCHPNNLLCQVASCPTGFNIHLNTLCSNMFDNVCRITTFANL